ncbi:MAG: OmpA family protein [Xanthobacteraceae bacterium]
MQRRPPPTVNAPLPPPPPLPSAAAPIPRDGVPRKQMEDFRSDRRQSEEGGRTVFREPGRVIVRDPSGQAFIRHNEVDRFRYGARDVRVEQRGRENRTIVVRPDGSQIITITDRDGRLLRRSRLVGGREIVIIDNSFRPPPPRPGFGPALGGFFVDLPPPVVRIPRDRYIVEADEADPRLIYETLSAPPVERIDRRYTLDEIRYSPSVRDRMPRIDLDTITFETGSWEITQDQAQRLAAIAQGINNAIARNPREVFLIEGHTDAVGSDIDNLSLSDRRAESVAQVLTEVFHVPPENLTSQGYGEQYLKVPTQGAERANRRSTIRRITPLLTGQNQPVPPPPPGMPPPRR